MKKALQAVFCLLFLVSFNQAFSQAPILTYQGPKVYPAGTAIAPLTPANTGGAVPGLFYGQVTILTDQVSSAYGVVMDTAKNIYTFDAGQNAILKINPAGVISRLAGGGIAGAVNGMGSAASFNNVQGITIDSKGNLYVADAGNNMIRKITPYGLVSTLAGNITSGAVNGTGVAASFYTPSGVAVDAQGNVFVADANNHLIRKITPAGVVTTLAGSGNPAVTNGIGTAASFYYPQSLAININGDIYVADTYNQLIRKVTQAGVVTTVAGSGLSESTDGTGLAASFAYPKDMALDASGNLYITDSNQLIRKMTPAGVVTTIVGAGTFIDINGPDGFSNLQGVVTNADGYMLLSNSYSIIKVGLTGYTVSPALPPGLNFDELTGTISGTPVLATAAKTYTITAYNTSGSSKATISIAVTGSITVAPPAINAPVLKYTTPQSYTAGTGITPLAPTNTGGAVPGVLYGQTTTILNTYYNTLGMVVDSAGNIYLSDAGASVIRKISPAGVMSVFAGNGSTGKADGIGTAASFYSPQGLARDAAGNIYVADANNNLIRKISPTGVVTTLAGSGQAGRNNGKGVNASFSSPRGVAVDAYGNVYVADGYNRMIRKISATGVVSTLAGSGNYGADNGTGSAATFSTPIGITLDQLGNIYVADNDNNLIRKITQAGVVTTYAGNGANGNDNGTSTSASFYYPNGLVFDQAGNLYVSDPYNYMVRKITPAGIVSTLAGGTNGSADGTGTAAQLGSSQAIAIDVNGIIYVSDGYTIRKVAAVGYNISPTLPAGLTFSELTGTISGTPMLASAAKTYTVSGYNIGGGSTTTLSVTVTGIAPVPAAITAPAISYTGPQTYATGTAITALLPANSGGAVPATIYGQTTTFAGTGAFGHNDGTGTTASFDHPTAAATDIYGNVYIADRDSHLIRKINTAGVVSTLAGSGVGGYADGTGTAAVFQDPSGIAVDKSGNVYVADVSNNMIRKITPAGVVTTLAGQLSPGNSDGTGTAASFYHPLGLAVDAAGSVYVADTYNQLIRKITAAGVVTTYAGSGGAGADNGAGTVATFNSPTGIAIDATNNLFVTDANNSLIRKITTAKVVSTFAGSGSISGADGQGVNASFYNPTGITIDKGNNLYVTDYYNHLIRKITSTGLVSTIAGNLGLTGSNDGIGAAARFNNPSGIAVDPTGNLYVTDSGNDLIRKIAATGYITDGSMPAGLTLNGATGAISGTPTAPVTAGVYTVTAINGGGSSTATINITVTGAAAPVVVPAVPQIAYQSPQSYVAGTAINTLNPTNTGGAVPAKVYAQVSTISLPVSNYIEGIAIDAAGNIYTSESSNNIIRKTSPDQVTTILAGNGSYGSVNGKGTAASFATPAGIVVDAQGNVFVADGANNMIRKITPSGVVTTFAGSTTSGNTNATGTAAKFNNPQDLAIDATGNIYVADYSNNLIRKITPAGVVSTFAGSGDVGSDNGTGPAASFDSPKSLVFDAAGNLYVADYSNYKIRKITPAGVVTDFAGSGIYGPTDGTATTATFEGTTGMSIDLSGNLFVNDSYSVRKITPAGVVTTIAGNYNYTASTDGIGTAAGFNYNRAIEYDRSGVLYTSDYGLIRKVSVVGYTIDSNLPTGLSFDASTGSITGTPIVAAAAKTYKVTAYNTGGLGTANLSVAVTGAITIPPATIQAPAISYSGPQNYAAGVAINNLSPVNTGGAVPAQVYGQTTTFKTLTSLGSLNGLAIDKAGNYYVCDTYLIRKITKDGVVSVLAGSENPGSADGTGTAASFNYPLGLAIDGAGNIYTTDMGNNKIRKITPAGVVTTLAGSGANGRADGPGNLASFNSPRSLAIDAYGNLFVADGANNVIRKITPSGMVSTFAGSPAVGSADGTGAAASFNDPSQITIDRAGNLFVFDYNNYRIRKITPGAVVTTFSGNGISGYTDGPSASASFGNVYSLAADQAGNVYISDNYRIRKINSSGAVSTIAGTINYYGLVDGTGILASFSTPANGLAVDTVGNVILTDNNFIRKVSATGYTVNSTLPVGLAFDSATGIISGNPLLATASKTYSITAFNAGGSSTANVGITVTGTATPPVATAAPVISYAGPKTYAVGMPIAPLQIVNTGGAVPPATYGLTSAYAGTGLTGKNDGAGPIASFNNIQAITADAYGNLFVADNNNYLVRKITPIGVVSTLAGSGFYGIDNGTGAAASFTSLGGIAVDKSNNVYVADPTSNQIRKITPAGVVTIFAGSITGASGTANGTGTSARFTNPQSIVIDNAGNLYVSDTYTYRIRKITPAGVVTTFAGSGVSGFANGTGTSAKFVTVQSMAIDGAGNIYVADDYQVRKITPAAVVTTLAGSETNGFADGTGAQATFSSQISLTTDIKGNIFVSDYNNGLIRKVTPAGVVTTIAGNGNQSTADGIGTFASFDHPQALTTDGLGNLFVTGANNLIRKISVSGYTLDMAQPSNLNFDATTGTFSGTPNSISPLTTYTVTGSNGGGSDTAAVGITVIYPPVITTTAPVTAFASMGDIPPVPVKVDAGLTVTDLSRTTLASATVSITSNFVNGQDVLAFTGNGTTGNIAATYNVSTGVLSLTSAGATATLAQWQLALQAVTYNNTNNVAPNVLSRTLSIVLNDGIISSFAATKTVTLKYTPSSNANLSSLALSAGTLSPVFAQATTTYIANVSNAISTIKLTDVTASTNAKLAINGSPVLSGTASVALPLVVGSNTITSVIMAQDSVTVKTYTVTITRAATQTITFAQPAAVTYGIADFSPTATSTNNTIPITYTSSNMDVATITPGGLIHILKAGTTTIKASQAGNVNFDAAADVSRTLTINPAVLTATPANKSKAYGVANPALTLTYSGFVNGDTQVTTITTAPTASTIATTASQVGNYAITASGGVVSPNYTLSYAAGTLTVNPTTLTILANDRNKNYGAVNPALTLTFTGFVNGDTQTSLTTQPVASTLATSSSAVGTYAINVSGAASPNYTISYTTGSLIIKKVGLTVTANNLSKAYGSVNPPLTLNYTGFVNSDGPASLLTTPVASTSATTTSAAGTYAITVSGGSSNNYTISLVQGTLTINAVGLTFNTIPTQVYGSADFDPGASSASAVTYTSSNTGVATIVAGKVHIVAPGSSNITANNGSTTQTQSLTVNTAPLTIAASNQTKTYGAANPAFTLNYTGFVNGDTEAGLTTPAVASSTATVSSGAGSYPISVANASSAKYSITYTAGTLTVNKAALLITADNQSKSTGTVNPTLTASYSGFVNGDTPASLITQPALSTTSVTSSPAGVYPITVGGAAAANYNITYAQGSLTVAATALVFNAIPSKPYGTADFDAGATSTAAITYASSNGAVAFILSGKVHIVGAGTSTITATSGGTSLTQTLTVTKVALTITADAKSRSYGVANPVFTATYTGFVNGDTTITTKPVIKSSATIYSPVAGYFISASGGISNNYTITYVSGKLTITKAPLTITADNKTKVTGASFPALTVSYSGFVKGDTADSLTTKPVVKTTATTSSPVGTYPLTPSGAVNANYAFTYVAGTLTVTAPPVTLVFNAIPAKPYGTADFDAGATSTSAITYTSSNAAVAFILSGKVHIIGAGTSNITATSSGTSLTQALTVSKVALTITADNKSRSYGVANPAFTATYTGLVNGDTTITTKPLIKTTATIYSPVSSGYFISSTGAASNNYTITYVSGKLTITKAPLTITADNKTKVTGAGFPALTVSYSGFVKGDTADSLTTKPIVKTTATTSSPAGTYPLTPSSAVNTNYAFTYVVGTLTVTAPPVTLVFNAIPAKPYGTADFDAGATSTSAITYTSSNAAVAFILSGKVHIIGAGTSNITATSSGTSLTQALTVSKAALTITADNKSRSYGVANPAFTATYTGLVNGDTTITTKPIIKTTATIYSPVSSGYFISSSGAASNNYTITYVSGKLSITKAPLTITADNKTKVTGAGFPALTVSYNGFVKGDTADSLTTKPIVKTTATTTSPAGTYPLTPSGAVNTNYVFTYVVGTLTVTEPILPPPNITYAGPQIYIASTTITTLKPVNTGGAVPAGGYLNVTTIAGNGSEGATNGTGVAASFNSPEGLAKDAAGNIYVADDGNSIIRKITPAGVVTTFAGTGDFGNANGTGTAASFKDPNGVATDAAGNLYIADTGNQLIRKITPAGVVTTFAGSGVYSSVNGTGTAASFSSPYAITTDVVGNVYVAEQGNYIRKITPAGVVTTLAGNGTAGSANGTGPGASFDKPIALTTDAGGNIYVSDLGNHLIRKITPAGVVTTLAGNGNNYPQNGVGTGASFSDVYGLTTDANSNVYVSESGSNYIRKITPNGVVTTFAGNGQSGSVDGIGPAVSFSFPAGIIVDASGNLIVADVNNNKIRKINTTGYAISPQLPAGLAFDSSTGYISGIPATARGAVNYTIIAYNKFGSDTATLNLTVNKNASTPNSPNIYTIIGDGTRAFGGDGKGAGGAQLNSPYAMAMDKAGNIYVASFDNRIRKITKATNVITTIAGNGTGGYSGDGGLAINAQFSFYLVGLGVDAAGNVYVSDGLNNRIRKIDVVTNIVTTVAGNGTQGNSGNGGLATSASLGYPEAIAFDAAGNMYISDNYSFVRKVDVNTHIISLFAGKANPDGAVSGVVNGVDAKQVSFGGIERISIDKTGNMYIADQGSNLVYRIDAITQQVTTVAGNGSSGYSSNPSYTGDGGLATSATFSGLMAATADSLGNIYISDQVANVIRKVDAVTHNISTYAGNNVQGYSGDGSSANLAKLNFLTESIVGTDGYLYVNDYSNNVIRRIGGSALPQTITAATLTSKIYGTADFAIDASASSGLPLVLSSSKTSVATIVNGKVHIVGVGNVNITVSQSGNVNYQAGTDAVRFLTVAAAAVKVTADNKTKTAGSANPAFTVTYTGLVNGETASVLTTLPTVTTTATAASVAGSYPITPAGAVAANYKFTYANGTLTVTATAGQSLVKTTSDVPAKTATDAVAKTAPVVSQSVSPNGDGIGDVLIIAGISDYADNRFAIMNLSGTKVYEAPAYDNVNRVFDGHSSINHSLLPAGTYFYQLEYKDGSEVKRKTGYVILKF